jgi:predicted Zn finger-like uncharacterized protein
MWYLKNNMSSTLSSQWDEGIKLVSFCPVCETRYNPISARVLGRQGETHLLHVKCGKCQNSIIALVIVNQIGASSVGLITDLAYDDVMRFRSATAITVDDVIGAHDLLGELKWEDSFGNRLRSGLSRSVRKFEKQGNKARASTA